MKLSQFKFKLPEEKIALHPTKYRDESRLLVLHRKTGEIEHKMFKDVLDYFDDKDVFIFNDTKVFPARLYGNKEKTGARIEVFLLRELNEELRLWDVLVDPARKIRIGNKLYFGDDDSMVAEVIDNTTSRGRTLRFLFDGSYEEFKQAVEEIGIPCVVKPVMSSSGHGQSVIKSADDIERSWHIAQEGGRAGAGRVIVEGFVNFDYEITLLTVRSISGTVFCEPVGHIQVDGDYRYSWQPQPMSPVALEKAREIAAAITGALGGHGIFGVELFIKGDDVIFSEVSPRPHDTGMVTMISQDLSEFALHARALLGLPVPAIRFYGPSASRAIVVEGDTDKVVMDNLEAVLAEPAVQLRIFGKPEVKGHRRMGVILATADTLEEARAKADRAYDALQVEVLPR